MFNTKSTHIALLILSILMAAILSLSLQSCDDQTKAENETTPEETELVADTTELTQTLPESTDSKSEEQPEETEPAAPDTEEDTTVLVEVESEAPIPEEETTERPFAIPSDWIKWPEDPNIEMFIEAYNGSQPDASLRISEFHSLYKIPNEDYILVDLDETGKPIAPKLRLKLESSGMVLDARPYNEN